MGRPFIHSPQHPIPFIIPDKPELSIKISLVPLILGLHD